MEQLKQYRPNSPAMLDNYSPAFQNKPKLKRASVIALQRHQTAGFIYCG
jgi:hypothetical protein